MQPSKHLHPKKTLPPYWWKACLEHSVQVCVVLLAAQSGALKFGNVIETAFLNLSQVVT